MTTEGRPGTAVSALVVLAIIVLPAAAGAQGQPRDPAAREAIEGLAGGDPALAARLQASMARWMDWEAAIAQAVTEQDAARARGAGPARELLQLYVSRADVRDTALDHYLAGRFLGVLDELEPARGRFEKALARDPLFYPAWNGLGTYWANRKDWKAAADAYRESLKINPRYGKSRLSLATCLYSEDRLADAESELRQLLADEPKNTDASLALAQVQIRRSEYTAAVEILDAVLKQVKDSMEASELLALCYSRLGRDEDAARLYNLLLDRRPGDWKLQHRAGDLFLQMGRNTDAVTCYEAALAALPSDSPINREALQRRIAEIRERPAREQRDPNRKTRREWIDVLLHSTEVERRREAIRLVASPESLAAITPDVYKAILQALKDRDPEVKTRALRALAEFSDPDLVKIVRFFLEDPDPMVRAMAAVTLRSLDHPSAVPHLIARLGTERELSVVGAIVRALDKLTPTFIGTGIVDQPTPEKVEMLRREFAEWYAANRARYRQWQ